MSLYDLNTAEKQRDFGALIPEGEFLKVKGTIRPGGASIPGAPLQDQGAFKAAAHPSDAVMIDWEFTVMTPGPYCKSKIWRLMTVAGGKVDEKGNSKGGNISKSDLRAMIESAAGIHPDDNTEQAAQRRKIPCILALQGIEFAIRVGIELGGDNPRGSKYPDKNSIDHIVVPGEDEWLPVMQLQVVPAKPSGRASAAAAPQTQWQALSGAAPLAAPQAATSPAAAGWQPPTIPSAAPAQAPAAVAGAVAGWQPPQPGAQSAAAPAVAGYQPPGAAPDATAMPGPGWMTQAPAAG